MRKHSSIMRERKMCVDVETGENKLHIKKSTSSKMNAKYFFAMENEFRWILIEIVKKIISGKLYVKLKLISQVPKKWF